MEFYVRMSISFVLLIIMNSALKLGTAFGTSVPNAMKAGQAGNCAF